MSGSRKKILLLCSGGLSTGILVKKMETAAERQGFACKIWAAPAASAGEEGADADLILLGPQVRFQMETVKAQVSCPVVSIDPAAYGTMNGENVLGQAMAELGENR